MQPSHVIVLLITVSLFQSRVSAEGQPQCSDVNRFGKSLQHVEPPADCLAGPGDTRATWCDAPGIEYPWQQIREYLHRSSVLVTERTGQLDSVDIGRLLNKYGIANTRIASSRRRRRRSADVTGVRDVTGQLLVREAGRVTSRGGSWGGGVRSTAPPATEATNFELQRRPVDVSSAGSSIGSSSSGGDGGHEGVKPATKRINDKNISEEDELVLLLTYFTNPNNVVFTESVLQGLLSLGDPSENDDGETTETDVQEFSQEDGSSATTGPQQSQVGDEGKTEEGRQATEPAGPSAEFDDARNETVVEYQSVVNTTAEAAQGQGDPMRSPQTATQTAADHIPSKVSLEPPLPSATSYSPHVNPPSKTLPASPPPSSPSGPSDFSDSHGRNPSAFSPGSSIHAHTRIGESSSPGTRTGADVLDDIQTGEDILADITGVAQTTAYHKGSSQDHDDSSWNEAGSVDWHGDDEDSWTSPERDESWTGSSHDSWTGTSHDSWADLNHDSWSDESIPPEVQYYRPTTAPTGSPDAADAFEWHDSPVPEWRPVRPSPSPPQAQPLIARPSQRVPQGVERAPLENEKVPLRVAGNSQDRETVVINYGERLTATGRPTAGGSVAAELATIEETVYTDPIYRPDEETEVSQTASTTTATHTTSTTTTTPRTTLETVTSPMTTTPDPYVRSACETSVEVRSPFYAMNTRNVWKMLINIPPFETYIHMEHCLAEHEQGLCAAGCRCTQRHTIRTMPVYVQDSNGCDRIYMDKFLFPSHCDCMCLPLHHVLFKPTRPAPTTPATSIVGLNNSTFLPWTIGGTSSGEDTDETTPPSGQRENSTLPSPVTDGASAEALKAAGFAARVVTAAPTPSPASRHAPGMPPPRTPPPRRPVVPVDSLVRSHRNRNRGPAFSSPLRRRTSTNVSRRNGRAFDILHYEHRAKEMPRPLPRR